MSRPALVLRPSPGDAATAARLAAAGVTAIRLPLFEVRPLGWTPPAGAFDGLLLTSANAVRHAGAGLELYRGLPIIAVGPATAAAARGAGFDVALVGDDDGVAAIRLATARGWHRLLRLTGRERTSLVGITDVAVYTSVERSISPGALHIAADAVALLHSSRAAQRFAALVDRDGVPRTGIKVVAISDKVAGLAGPGWGALRVAAAPDDPAMVAVAATLAIDP